jgi:CheY-like chemotaxis protein
MSQDRAYTLTETEMAEGSPGPSEEAEPSNPLKTTTIPAITGDGEKVGQTAETGVAAAVGFTAEGRDDGDAQDASRTTDESKPTPSNERKPAMHEDKAPLVLIVEDTTELAEVIQATLERMNIRTVHETHGNKAVSKFIELNPDIVLLDISLPDMMGWKIMDIIKERFEQGADSATMPIVIVITAYDDPANRLVGKLQGIHSYLIKPFTADEIERIVTQAISSATQ